MRLIALLSLLLISTTALADDPRIVAVEVSQQGMDWRLDVTIEHADTGWDHYADGWKVLDADGNRIGYRKLHHPHVEEQPFTRSLSHIMVPDGATEIYVRAHCSVDGWASEKVRVELNP